VSAARLSAGEVADAAFDAIGQGDFDRFLQSFTFDAVVWHNYDGADMPITQIRDSLVMLKSAFPDLSYEDRRWVLTEDGVVHQHVLRGTSASGDALEIWSCWRAYARPGERIHRVENYLDSTQAQTIGRVFAGLG
jgi:ketosteroid isomerase-like protein